MTLEVLFAQAAQGRIFLQMVLCGTALALGGQLAGLAHRSRRLLGLAADLLLVLAAAAGMAQILLGSGGGLRLYALLGLCVGALLWLAGPGALIAWGVRRWQRKALDASALAEE